MIVRGFCEKAYETDRPWKGKPTYEAVIDGKKVGFFLDKDILAYGNKEVTYDETTKGDFLNGKLVKEEKPKEEKPAARGWQPKSKEEIEMSAKTMLMSYAKDIIIASIQSGHEKKASMTEIAIAWMALYETAWLKLNGVDSIKDIPEGKEPF